MKKALISFSFIVAVLFVPGLAKADIGPKPSMSFKFVSDRTFSINSGQQIECKDSSCKGGKPLEQLGPQHFSCTKDSCSSLAYGYKEYHKLVLNIDGKKMESNVFATKGENSSYTVYVSADKITVDAPASSSAVALENLTAQTLAALVITLVVELLLLLIIIPIFKLPWKILLALLVANITSVPVLWLVTGWINLSSIWILFAGEIIVVFYEALIYYLFLKKKFGYGKMIALSAVLNAASFFFSMFIRM